MDFHVEQLRIIKELFLEYQEKQSEEVFYKIIERVDPLLAELVGRFSKTYYYIEDTPQLLQDLYQCAVSTGMEKVINDFDPEAHPKVIPSWIFHVIRNVLWKVYGRPRFNAAKYMYEHPNCQEKSDNDAGLIREDIHYVLDKLVREGGITHEDLQLFVLVRVENIPIRKVMKIFGNRWGKSHITLTRRVEATKSILKRGFRKHGFTHA